MQYLEALTFMTKAEVIRKYKIPEHLQAELFAEMPVAGTNDGKPLYFEGQVDAFLQERFPYRPTPAPYQRVQGARPRGGRKVTTDHEAMYALFLKSQGNSMKEIVTALKIRYPERKDYFTTDAVRKCMERYEMRQARKGEDNLGINPIRPR
jgi:hypothetical protein